jgi:hypothetical protein
MLLFEPLPLLSAQAVAHKPALNGILSQGEEIGEVV